MNYYLKVNCETQRVIIDSAVGEKKERVLRCIDAPNWGVARDDVKDGEFAHHEGYGYYVD